MSRRSSTLVIFGLVIFGQVIFGQVIFGQVIFGQAVFVEAACNIRPRLAKNPIAWANAASASSRR